MENEKQLETLAEEVKLMKGELKQSLASVRDYLLNMELPSSEFATVLAALGGEGDQKITVDGSLMNKMVAGPAEAVEEEEKEPEDEEVVEEQEPEDELEEPLDEDALEGPEAEDAFEGAEAEDAFEGAEAEDALEGAEGEDALEGAEAEDASFEPESELAPGEEDLLNEEEPLETESEMLPEDELTDQDENLKSEDALLTEEEQPMEHENINAEVSQSIPKVNLLANLINWVAKAKKEIGPEQMPTFLEVYGVSGHLSPELKEVILHLVEITAEQPEDASTAEVWSEAMLSLHGILAGGNAPFYPIQPFLGNGDGEADEDELIETEVEKTKNLPVKLKLVFPNGDGKGKEYCIGLTPEEDDSES